MSVSGLVDLDQKREIGKDQTHRAHPHHFCVGVLHLGREPKVLVDVVLVRVSVLLLAVVEEGCIPATMGRG